MSSTGISTSSTSSSSSSSSSLDQSIRIKCILGGECRIIKVNASIAYERLLEQLENDFGLPVVIYQYEDNEGDTISVRGREDLLEAFNMCNELRLHHNPNQPTRLFKFFLKPMNAGSLRDTQQLQQQQQQQQHRDSQINTSFHSNAASSAASSPMTTGINMSNSSIGHIHGNGSNNVTPSSSSSSLIIQPRKGSNAPPLRTPPPSPPGSPLSFVYGSPITSYSPPHSSILSSFSGGGSGNNINNTSTNSTKDLTPPLRTPPGSPKYPPPLRTPPPSPPPGGSPNSGSFMRVHRPSIGNHDDFILDDEPDDPLDLGTIHNQLTFSQPLPMQPHHQQHQQQQQHFGIYSNQNNNNGGGHAMSNSSGGIINPFRPRSESGGRVLARPSSPQVMMMNGGIIGNTSINSNNSNNSSNNTSNNNNHNNYNSGGGSGNTSGGSGNNMNNSPNTNRGSADMTKFNNFPTLIINEHEELVNLQPIRWKKGQLLGRGGYGAVYLGLNCDTGELVAVKQLELVDVIDAKYKSMLLSFSKDIEVLRLLKHDNIVRYLGTCLDSTHLNVFLEYIPGGSISSLLGKFGPFSESIIKLYTKQILQGLQYLHSNQIIHRDIKGANILIDTKGSVKLTDFGCSKMFSGIVSQFKSMHGTPYWMAPEVIKQTGHGRSSDIWSLGCVIIEMATAAPPWSNITEMAAVMYHIASTSAMPNFPNTMSPEAIDFLTLCFKRDPKERPDAGALLKHPFLSNIIDAQELPVPVPTPPKYRFSLTTSPLQSPNATSTTPTTVVATAAPATMSSLPRSLMILIFSCLSPASTAAASSVCKAWKNIFDDDDLWSRFCNHRGMNKISKDQSWKASYIHIKAKQRTWFESKINQSTLKGHSKCIYSVKLVGDSFVMSGGEDKKLKMWDIKKAKHLYSLKGHTGIVQAVDNCNDLSRLFTASSDFSAKVWSTKTKKATRTYTGHKEAVTSINFLGDVEGKVLTSSLDNTLHIWDAETGSTLSTLLGHTNGIYSVRYDRDSCGNNTLFNNTVVSASADCTARVWDTRTSTCVRVFSADDDVTSVYVVGGQAVTGCGNGTVKLWDIGTGRTINTFIPQETQQKQWVWSVQFDPYKIISSGKSGVIRIWDPYNNQTCRTMGGHHETIFSLHFKDNKLATSSKDKLVKIWSIDDLASSSSSTSNGGNNPISSSSSLSSSGLMAPPPQSPPPTALSSSSTTTSPTSPSAPASHHHHHSAFPFLSRQSSSAKLH
ncbi:hypothetical protein SAMD00019534_012290 [Acytostelium subglobosum LB1]|uniref:hypothetical protein n=1 Tax=Acytostelium subglobosum LB1 TaxID=1410327 RepID=UPI000644B6B1|nr:hypothetical protein SAMD00019534_012290 [Acytostelium subglobosum LB1]GAM18054.1 hypothetical protein SAMD00019534_012290 [Acytostelium subglobosum LB1]|eukprot:XP_012758650.1 hypothetical protein SAMD00019534_012290 [Acytostelium subglobosum LB1]